MAKAVLFARLAAKDLRRHTAQAMLLFLVIAAASATLTIGLVLHGVTRNPYNTTRAATKGPDVVANLTPSFAQNGAVASNADPARLAVLEHAPGVTGYGGPYPFTFALLTVRGITTTALVEGRDPTPAPLDEPALPLAVGCNPAGSWSNAASRTRSANTSVTGSPLAAGPFGSLGSPWTPLSPPYPHVCGVDCTVIYRPSISNEQISQHEPSTRPR